MARPTLFISFDSDDFLRQWTVGSIAIITNPIERIHSNSRNLPISIWNAKTNPATAAIINSKDMISVFVIFIYLYSTS